MPSHAPLDPSWVIGLNQAVAQKIQFGKGLIFTFGPYASIYTKAFHPSTNYFGILGSTYLSVLYVLAILFVMRKANYLSILGICILFSGFISHLDAVFYSYGLLVGIYCYQISGQNGNWKNILLMIILFSGFGLYPLIKGPIFVLLLPIALICIFYLFWKHKWLESILIPITITLSMSIFWHFANQDFSNLSSYFSGLGILITGFSQAMSLIGDQWEILGFIGASFLIVIYLIFNDGFKVEKLYLAVIFGLYLFVTFKAGFVRHDGHALISGEALAIASLLAVAISPSNVGYFLVFLTLTVFINIESHYKPNIRESFINQFQTTYISTWNGVRVRVLQPTQLEIKYKEMLKSIHQLNPLPKLNGTSDIYPFDQSLLIASENIWNPRPIFQSYHAYTNKLADLNKAFLESANAPDNIFFRIESIDGRFPSNDDGLSWPVILNKYMPNGFVGQFLILEKKTSQPTQTTGLTLLQANYQLNSWIKLPQVNKPIWASIDIEQSWTGKIKRLIFKSSFLVISIRMNNGESKQFRLIPENSKQTFLLSPLIENAREFNSLYIDTKSLESKKIKEISISVDGNQRDWQNTYTITLTTNEETLPPLSK